MKKLTWHISKYSCFYGHNVEAKIALTKKPPDGQKYCSDKKPFPRIESIREAAGHWFGNVVVHYPLNT